MQKVSKLGALTAWRGRRANSGRRVYDKHRRLGIPGGFAAVAVAAGLAGAAAPAAAGGGLDFDPAVVLVKSASVQSYSAAGTSITYTFKVTNTGDVPLTNVTLADPMAGLSAINCGNGTPVIAQLTPGASATCTATYLTTAQDVTAGSITNTATVAGTAAPGRTVRYNSSMTIPEPGHPYRCINPPFYFLSESQSTGPTTLFGSTTSPATYAPAPASPYPGIYNAIAFDPTGASEGYIFGLTRVGGANELIKIDDTGAVMPGYPKAVGGLPAAPPLLVVGAFDNLGNYWVTDGGTGGTAYEINVNTATPSATSVPLTPTSMRFGAYDWTYYSGYLWGLQGNQIYRVKAANPGIGGISLWTLPFIPPTPQVYGAAWTFGNGDLGFSNNGNGLIYEIKVTSPNTPTFSPVGLPYAGPQSANRVNDGTACAGKGTNLGIVASGPATAPAASTVTWNLTVTNDGPANSSGYLVSDVLKGRMSGLATATPGCAVTHKGGEVQCAEGTLDNGDPFTVSLSATMPQAAGACVVNTATVIGNEADHEPGNDSSSVKTCATASPTWTVKPGGSVKAASGAITLKDTKTGAVMTCKSSAASGTLKSGSGLAGTAIGSVTALSFSTCTGPAGLTLTAAPNALPWALNALTYNAGVTDGTLTGIDATLFGTGCTATVDGTAAGADNGQVNVSYTNSTGRMQLLASGGNLTLDNVSGCAGLINSGDAATLTGTYTVTPKQLITSP